MKTLIVYAHPDVEGHNSTVLKEVEIRLKNKKIDYEIIDLYKIKYDPVLKEDELYTAGNRSISEQNKKIQEKIRSSERLIFIYPIWWNTMPAVLKGFIDRVFTPHFAFRYSGKIPEGMLKNKAAVFVTGSSSNLMSFIFLGNRASKIMKKDILKFCGIKSKVFRIGNATGLTDKQVKKIKKAVSSGLNYLYS